MAGPSESSDGSEESDDAGERTGVVVKDVDWTILNLPKAGSEATTIDEGVGRGFEPRKIAMRS